MAETEFIGGWPVAVIDKNLQFHGMPVTDENRRLIAAPVGEPVA